MNKEWHSSHFCCWQCDESLTGQRYVLRDEHPYCIRCYESVFANSCDECNQLIGIDSKVSGPARAGRTTSLFFEGLSWSFIWKLYYFPRIYPTRRSTGMKCVSFVASAESHSWTSNLDPRWELIASPQLKTSNSNRKEINPKGVGFSLFLISRRRRFTAVIAMMPNLPHGVMDAEKFSEQVSRDLLFFHDMLSENFRVTSCLPFLKRL